MITVDRELLRKILAGHYAITNQTFTKAESEKFIEAGLFTFDLIMKSMNKVEVKDPIKTENDKLEIVQ